MLTGSDSEFFDDDLVLMRQFFVVEHGDNYAGTLLSPSSTDTSIDTPATGGFSPETLQSLHEYAADSHDQIAIPPPTPLSLSACRGKDGSEGQIASNSENTTVFPSNPRRSRHRRGGPCPLCGIHLSRLDHYRLNNHYISCPNYTGDREVLKARYRRNRKPKQAEKDTAHAQAEATAVVLTQPLPPRVRLDEQAPCSKPINHPGVQVAIGNEHHQTLAQRRRNLLDVTQVSTSTDAVANSPLARNRSGFPACAQEPTIEVQAAMTTETDRVYEAMELLSQSTFDSHYPLPHNGSADAIYPANDVCSTQPYSYLHPDIQDAMHIIPGQPQSHWGSFYAAQVSISTNAVADRRPSCLELNCPAYTNEIQETTPNHFPVMELSSQPSFDPHYPMPRNVDGNVYPTDDGSMVQSRLYTTHAIPTQHRKSPFYAAQVPVSANVVADRCLSRLEPNYPAYEKFTNEKTTPDRYPAMELSSQPTLIPRNDNGDAIYPTNGTIMLQLGSYTNTRNSDWHSLSTTSGWEQS